MPIVNPYVDLRIANEDLSASCNGVTTQFSTANKFVAISLMVTLNGVRQRKDTDYSEDVGLVSFTMVSAPLTGEELIVDYVRSVN